MFKRKALKRKNIGLGKTAGTFFASALLLILVACATFFYYKGEVGAAGNAVLSLSPATSSINVGDPLTVDINVDPMGDSIVVVRAMLDYDPAVLDFTGWDTTGSLFAAGNDCQVDNGGNPCQIIDNDEANGTVSITLAMPTPGTNASGLVVKANFTALTPVSSSTSALALSFVGSDDYTDSDVIADDGAGTDLLDSVTGMTLTVSGTDNVAPTLTLIPLTNGRAHNRTPIFESTEPGTIQFGGDCAGFTGSAVAGENRIDFSSLTLGSMHNNCTVQVTDAASNQSAPLAIPEFTVTYRSDLNFSGGVNIFDYNLLLGGFGVSTCGHAADINNSCSVNIFDYNIMLGEFGSSI